MIYCSQGYCEWENEGEWERMSIEEGSDRVTKRRLNELIMREIEWIQKKEPHRRE